MFDRLWSALPFEWDERAAFAVRITLAGYTLDFFGLARQILPPDEEQHRPELMYELAKPVGVLRWGRLVDPLLSEVLAEYEQDGGVPGDEVEALPLLRRARRWWQDRLCG